MKSHRCQNRRDTASCESVSLSQNSTGPVSSVTGIETSSKKSHRCEIHAIIAGIGRVNVMCVIFAMVVCFGGHLRMRSSTIAVYCHHAKWRFMQTCYLTQLLHGERWYMAVCTREGMKTKRVQNSCTTSRRATTVLLYPRIIFEEFSWKKLQLKSLRTSDSVIAVLCQLHSTSLNYSLRVFTQCMGIPFQLALSCLKLAFLNISTFIWRHKSINLKWY